MKKLFVHLSMLALLAALLVPMVGCNKDKETEVDETPATSATTESATTTTSTTTSMGTDMGTGMGTTDTMGSDMGAGTTAPMGTEMTPPAKK
jgi:hypothetical protein